jgi:stage IV sporulation protein FB
MNFRFLNIPVQIHPTYWLFLFFFTDICRDPSIEGIILGIVFSLSLLVHEYGHALTARWFGATPTITLGAFGGFAQYSNRGITSAQDFIITLNGPLADCILAILSYGLLKLDLFYDHPYIEYFLYITMRLNILWCLLNLIPASPLDGGHLVRYFLDKKFGEESHKLSILIGLICIILVVPYLYYKGLFFFGTLLVIYGIQNFQELRSAKGSFNQFSIYTRGIEAINNNENEKAKNTFRKLLKSKDLQIRYSAIESLAKIYFEENECKKSYDLLLKSDHQLLKEGKCLLCKLAFEQKNYALIEKYSRDIYSIEPSFEIAILNSKAFAFLRQPTLAGAWLVTASQFGELYRANAKEILLETTYNQVRDHDSFNQYVEKI